MESAASNKYNVNFSNSSKIVTDKSVYPLKFNPDGWFARTRKSFTLLTSAILLLSSMVLTNVLQIITSPIILISRPFVYALNSYFAGGMWLLCQHMFENQNGISIEISGMESIPKSESALIISNHCSFIDFCLVHSIPLRCKMIGNCRYFSKDSIKYIPFLGWGMYFAGFIFLKRNWATDQRKINATFETLVKNKLPVQLISYLEGTRITKEKIAEAHEYAAKNNLPQLDYTLLPRSKGFAASVKGLRGSHINHVYDITIAYYHHKRGFGATPSLSDYVLGRLNEYQFRVHVDRYCMDSLPENDNDIAKWLIKLYEEKNVLLAKWKSQWDSQWKLN